MKYSLTSDQIKILNVLAKATDWMTRKQIGEISGRSKGYSAAMGAPTNVIKHGSLEDLALVERKDMKRPFLYRITEAGRRALANA
ncbi:hypothetical protein QU481_12050 [Crenobacter sp. SG2303]|uniref:MarR family transcriptional regulator n=1 Tax=Crenobacter oryzisoli TaxID=3056844 RepID=A0ABT7XPE3_9NEIS|nr:hypothetical protein [Crenobacter sp. SG2303]MDN0075625.1 hypothetical protein [Crenobacter sp. SG2303]